MSRGLSLAVAMVALVASISAANAAAAAGGSDSMADGLVDATDLPGEWASFTPPGTVQRGRDLCGKRIAGVSPPVEEESTAWAVNPDDGPIFGERIERYASVSAARRAVAHGQRLPSSCRFTAEDGSRWRTTRLSPPLVGGDGGWVYLVTSRDRSDSYNYEVAIRSDATVVRAVLNSRRADRQLLDQLVAAAWAKAQTNGAV